MGKWTKLREKILLGESDANIPFEDLRHLLLRFGLDERVRGSRHIFSRSGIEEILNLQPKGPTAKAYPVGQVRDLILKYRLGHD